MSIVESDRPPSWSLDASETGESTKCPWGGVVEGMAGEKNRETVTASLCLVFNSCGRVLAPPQIKSINNFLSWRKNLSDRGIWYQLRVASRHFKIQGLQVNVHCSRNRLNAVTKLSQMDSENVSKGRKLRWYTRCVCSWCGVNFKFSVPKEQVYFGRKELELTKFA